MVFKFKEFSICQNNSAAKITTDATVFAAWLPDLSSAFNILEIGAGTGVMSVMVAQRCDALIDAVEIEKFAFNEAKFNFSNSPYSNRLRIMHTSVQEYYPALKYDVIFSNPPFFNNNLLSEKNLAKNTAYHTLKLPFYELAVSANRLIAENGSLFVMLPLYESELFDKEMEKLGYGLNYELFIAHNVNKKPLRRIVGYCKEKKHPLKTDTIYIRNVEGAFDQRYKELLTPFLTIF